LTEPQYFADLFADQSKFSMKLYLASLGCAKNLVDSEIMLGRLTRAGWTITPDPGEARVILVNTCCFIEPAADESIDTILELAAYKKQGSCERLVVCGCLPQRYGEDILTALPEVDLFAGTGAFDRIESLLSEFQHPPQCVLPDPESAAAESPGSGRMLTTLPMAYVKIAEGCSRRCTYCIIPKLRGRHRSRPMETILNEARELIKLGALELNLIAQDTTSYGRDLNPPTNLACLLEKLSGLSGDVWIRFLYGHPEAVDENLIRTVSTFPNICSYFDIPVQHSEDRILKRMGRGHAKDDLLRLFARIRDLAPESALRTSLVVGFPGETERDVENLLDFIESIRFDHLGVFVYSDSQDLASHRLSGHIPARVARERMDRIMTRQAEISLKHNRNRIGRILEVLVEGVGNDGRFVGRSRFQAPEVDGTVIFGSRIPDKAPQGGFASVRIDRADTYDLFGEAV
jgi:ribosomal protein S12 methylthiotransferase